LNLFSANLLLTKLPVSNPDIVNPIGFVAIVGFICEEYDDLRDIHSGGTNVKTLSDDRVVCDGSVGGILSRQQHARHQSRMITASTYIQNPQRMIQIQQNNGRWTYGHLT
jgi:hypothetical protein